MSCKRGTQAAAYDVAHRPVSVQGHAPRHRTAAASLLAIVGLAAATATAPAHIARAHAAGLPGLPASQPENPVYLDDAPVAGDTLQRVRELAQAGSVGQAVRVLQRLIDESGDRLLEREPDLYIPVSLHAELLLLATPDLLEPYRQSEEAAARALVEDGRLDDAVRTRLITPSGLEAALRLAQRHYEAGRFEAARLTLDRVADHPDREPGAAGMGGDLAHAIAWYLGRPSATAWAERFAGGPMPRAVRDTLPASREQAVPARIAMGVETIDDEPDELPVERVVSRPLHSWELLGIEERQIRRSRQDRGLWIRPVVSGETVFVNDGARFGAWDRFTLSLRWQVEPEITDRTFARTLQTEVALSDGPPGALAVGPSVVAGVTGRPVESGEWVPRVVHTVERDTGRLLWSWHPVLEDAAFGQASATDEIALEEGTVVVPAMKLGSSRRLWSAYVFGLDAWSGRVKWSRLVASAGAVPYSSSWEGIGSGGTIHEGVLYRVEGLGVVAAIEVESGRVRWARTFDGRASWIGGPSNEPSPTLTRPRPLIDGGSVIALLRSRNEILRLDLETGAVLGRRNAAQLESPRYLIRAGDRLGAIGLAGVVTVPIDAFETAPGRRGSGYPGDGFVGRAIGSADAIMVPTRAGLLLIDPADPDPDRATLVELDRSGQALAVEGQVLAADTEALHGYLVWEVAERVLSRRMEERTNDPDAAMTYLELAHQAGRPERLIEAADRALDAIDRLAADEQDTGRAAADRAAGRLFEALETIATDEAFRARERGTTREVIDRLGRAARTPVQSVVHLLELGRFEEQEQRPAEAVAAYQRLLDDDTLAPAMYQRGPLAVRSGREASDRIERLIARHGPAIYAPHAARAEARLRDAADAEGLEAVARRFPGWEGAPRAWLAAGTRHAADGDADRAIAAFRAGMESRLRRDAEGDGALGELAGQLIVALARGQREAELAAWTARVRAEAPGLEITVDGAPIVASAFDRLVERLASERRAHAAAPSAFLPEAGVLKGWRLESPMLTASSRPMREQAIVSRPGDPGRTIIGAVRASAAGAEITWQHQLDAPVRLVRRDASSVDLLAGVNGRQRLVRLETALGKVLWQTEPIETLLHGSPEKSRAFYGSVAGAASTPLDGSVRARDLLLNERDGRLLIVDRAGSAAMLELATGTTVWSARSGVGRVFDATIAGGQAVIAGAGDWSDPDEALEPTLASLEAQTGGVIRVGPGTGEPVRWMRTTPRGRLLVASGGSIALVDPRTQRAVWSWSGAEAGETVDAWILGDRVFALHASAGLLAGRITPGGFDASLIPGTGRLRSAGAVRATEVDRGYVFASSGGIVALDRAGGIVGADALDRVDRLLPAAVARDRMFTVDRLPDSDAFPRVYALDHTGRLVAEPVELALPPGVSPEAIAVIDGAVLIEAGRAIVVLRGPVENAGNGASQQDQAQRPSQERALADR